VFAVLYGYFDDAGTHDGSPVVCWGGFVGTMAQWDKLDEAWAAKLARPADLPPYAPQKPALSRFHLTECEHGSGEFLGYSRADSDALQRDFREIIYASGVVGVAYCIDREAYDRVVADPKAREFLGDPEQTTFGACWTGALQQARHFFPDEQEVTLVFDYVMGPRLEKLRAVADRIEQAGDNKPRIVSAGLAKMIDTCPLQAADILATENYWDAKAFLTDEGRVSRPHMANMLKNVHCNGFIMREPEIRHYMWKHGYGIEAARR
jgi:hypothetical protein